MLAAGEYHATKCNQALVLNCVADDRKRLQLNLVSWRDKIRAIGIAIINLGSRHETVDLDGVSALDLDLLDLVVLNVEVLLPNFIAADDRLFLDDLARFGVNQLLLKPVAGFLVYTGTKRAQCSTTPDRAR